MSWTVGEVARSAGVTVRTLHHYDAIGLLSPSGRSAAGYRLYGHEDLERLQRILAYRVVGMELDAIAGILDNPDVDPIDHLRQQHRLLRDRRAELTTMITALEKTMDAHRMGIRLDPDELFEVFGDDDPTQHAEEVERRWGEEEAYRQSRERAATYGKADWQRMNAQMDDHNRRMVTALQQGTEPDSSAGMALAEEHRQHISQWFYDCSPARHRSLGEMYLADPRFAASYERLASGLAQWVHDAWMANAEAAEAKSAG